MHVSIDLLHKSSNNEALIQIVWFASLKLKKKHSSSIERSFFTNRSKLNKSNVSRLDYTILSDT